MKKVFIVFAIILGVLLFPFNTKAYFDTTKNITIDVENTNYTSVYNSVLSTLESAASLLDSKGFKYVLSFGKDSNSQTYPFVQVTLLNGNDTTSICSFNLNKFNALQFSQRCEGYLQYYKFFRGTTYNNGLTTFINDLTTFLNSYTTITSSNATSASWHTRTMPISSDTTMINNILNNNNLFYGTNTYFAYVYKTNTSVYVNDFSSTETAPNYYYNINSNNYTNGSLVTPVVNFVPVINYQLKNSFSSADFVFNDIELHFTDEDIYNTTGFHFKLQVEANDPSNPVVPTLVEAGLYGLPLNSKTGEYELITDENILQHLNMTYEIDTSLGQYLVVGSLSSDDLMTFYNDYKIAFNFNKTDNCTIHAFDDSSFNGWQAIETFLHGYIKYTFPEGKPYALISSSTATIGRIYTTYNAIVNDDYLLRAFNYDYTKNETFNELVAVNYSDYPHYSYFDFSLNYEQNQIVILARVLSDLDDSFYVPSSFRVTFLTDVYDEALIDTPNGEADLDLDVIVETDYNSESFAKSFTSSFLSFTNGIKYVTGLIFDFYTGLSVQIKMFINTLFFLSISLFIVRFLL